MAVGEAKPYTSAPVILEKTSWHRLAAQLGLDPEDESSLQLSQAIDYLLEKIDKLTTHLQPLPKSGLFIHCWMNGIKKKQTAHTYP